MDDKMGIQFEAETGKASSQINSLADKLDNLGKQTTEVAKALDNFSKSMSNAGNTKVKPKTKSLDKLKKSLDEMANAGQITQFEKKIAKLDITILHAFSNLKKGIDKAKEKLTSLGNKAEKVFGKIKKGISDAFSGLGKILGGVGKVLGTLGNVGKKSANAIWKGFKKLNKVFSMTALALLGVRGTFTAIRKAISEYMNYDEALNDQLRNDWAVLGSLLAPVLERIINLFSKLVSYVASFIKALTGIDLVARANARGLEKQAKSTKKANNELGNLANFDDLNVVNFDKDKGSGDDFTPLKLEEIDTSPIDRFIAKLEANDWYGIGMEIARKISEGLSTINFDVIIEKAKQWGRNMGDLFNGLVDGLSTKKAIEVIGDTLSGIVNTITGFLASFGDRAHFDDLGRLIAKGLNDAIEKINVEDLGKALSLKWKAIIETLYGFVTTFNWGEFGTKVGQTIVSAFKNINWEHLARILHDGFIGIFDAGKNALDEIDWKDVGRKLMKFIDDIDISDVASHLKDLLGKVFSSLGDIVSGFGEDKKGKILLFGGSLLVLAGILKKVFGTIKKGKDAKGDMDEVSDGLSTFQRIGDGVKDMLSGIGQGFESLGKTFESLGKAVEIIAILGGIKLVLDSLNELFKTFVESGYSILEIGGLLAETLGSIALAFTGIALATKLLDWEGIIGAGVILGGLTLTLKALGNIIDSVAKSGMKMSDITNLLIGLVGTITGLVTAFTVASLVLTTNPLALAGLLALVGSISAILLVVKATLPTILDAVGKFINNVAPPLIKLLNTIGDIIEKIIYALGKTLPPIINSVGGLFTSIFNGIAKVIRTVGDVIVDVMNTGKNLITGVLDKIMWFVDNIGSAVENSVDHILNAVRKVINFIVQGMAYLINTAIVKPINKLIGKINDNAIAEKLGWQIGKLAEVEIKPFAPKLATGTNKIEQEGLYHLHKNEAVVPEKYNPAVNNQVYENTNDRLIERIDRFMSIVENMETTNVFKVDGSELHRSTKRYLDKQAEIYGY